MFWLRGSVSYLVSWCRNNEMTTVLYPYSCYFWPLGLNITSVCSFLHGTQGFTMAVFQGSQVSKRASYFVSCLPRGDPVTPVKLRDTGRVVRSTPLLAVVLVVSSPGLGRPVVKGRMRGVAPLTYQPGTEPQAL